ncbi:hypothetical protein ACIHCV_45185 [Streptomyces sp. NPDC051956]
MTGNGISAEHGRRAAPEAQVMVGHDGTVLAWADAIDGLLGHAAEDVV